MKDFIDLVMSTSKLQQGTQNFSLSLLFSGTQHAACTIEELPWFWTGHSVYCQIQCVLPFFFDLNFINGVLCRYFGSTGQLHLKEYRALFNLQRSRLPGEPFQNDITGKISLSLNMFSNTMQVTHTNLIRVPVILSTLLISCWFLYDASFHLLNFWNFTSFLRPAIWPFLSLKDCEHASRGFVVQRNFCHTYRLMIFCA